MLLRLGLVAAVTAIGAGLMLTGCASPPAANPAPQTSGEIAFSRRFPESAAGIYLVRSDGSGLRRLTRGVDLFPSWSPDGRRLAFTRHGRVRDARWVYILEIKTGSLSRVPGTLGARQIDWSPDGQQLAIVGEPGRMLDSRLYLLSFRRPVAVDLAPAGLAGRADWSPDGRRIAFEGTRRITVLDIRTRRAKTLDEPQARSPTWSPDQQRLAYSKYDSRGTFDFGGQGIFTIASSGKGRAEVTDPPSKSNDDNPAWSPDGHALVYSRSTHELYLDERLGDTGLYVVSAEGGESRRITPRWLYAIFPTWRP